MKKIVTMSDKFEFCGFTIQTLYERSEVNYLVYNSEYFFKLVPFEDGFKLSDSDLHLSSRIPRKIINIITDHILERNA